ncbi:MAG TPA: VCBS repeat-containing protein, partial [Chitinophagaceae bacterium]|nr:VCBS repeat-containing protein [Chitinophagaceae bacterium]
MPSSKTNITFTNKLEKKELFNILYYLYYYNGGGVGTGDINNDGLPDIYFAANSKGNNKLYLNKGNFEFEDITEKAKVAGTADWCTGVTMADINSDGFLDIYVSTISG